MKLKKILSEQWVGVYLLIGVAALYFIYSLGFMSNFYRLFFDGNLEMLEFYKQLQLLNQFIFKNAVATVIFSVFALAFDIHKKKYGWGGAIYLIGFLGYEVSNVSTIFGSIPYYKNKYMNFDFSIIDGYIPMPIIFTLTYAFYLIIILLIIMLIILFTMKWLRELKGMKGVKPNDKR